MTPEIITAIECGSCHAVFHYDSGNWGRFVRNDDGKLVKIKAKPEDDEPWKTSMHCEKCNETVPSRLFYAQISAADKRFLERFDPESDMDIREYLT